jgi:hypothetical protein
MLIKNRSRSGFMLLEILLVMSLLSLMLPELSRHIRLFISFINMQYETHVSHLDRMYVFDELHADIQDIQLLTHIDTNDYSLTQRSGHYVRYSLDKGRLGRSYDGKRRHFLCNAWKVNEILIEETSHSISFILRNNEHDLLIKGYLSP